MLLPRWTAPSVDCGSVCALLCCAPFCQAQRTAHGAPETSDQDHTHTEQDTQADYRIQITAVAWSVRMLKNRGIEA